MTRGSLCRDRSGIRIGLRAVVGLHLLTPIWRTRNLQLSGAPDKETKATMAISHPSTTGTGNAAGSCAPPLPSFSSSPASIHSGKSWRTPFVPDIAGDSCRATRGTRHQGDHRHSRKNARPELVIMPHIGGRTEAIWFDRLLPNPLSASGYRNNTPCASNLPLGAAISVQLSVGIHYARKL